MIVTFEVSKFDKSIDVNLEHPWNNPAIFSSETVFIFPNLTFSKFEQPSKIYSIFSTFEISKLDKSIEVNLLQPWNILIIFLREEVSIFPKFTCSKFEQPKNINSISTTFEVSKMDKSIEFNLEQP